MKNFYFFTLLLVLLISCSEPVSVTPAKKGKSLISYVNPFIGTGGHGHTYPGATMPFGMMQLSPDTRLDGWDGCSGYHYSDSYIYGFSHTHLSGTGVSDYGDILLMPTDTLIFNNGADGRKGYRAHFSHDNEKASPGYYKVHLDATNIDVELTVTPRAGIHKYTYPASENQHLILDLEHRDMILDINVREISKYEVSGYRFSKAWTEDQRLYFYMKFSHPIDIPTHFHRDPDRRTRMAGYTFINPNNEPVTVRIGISAVDEAGAKKNLEAEIGNRSFEEIKASAEDAWEKQLEKIVIESTDNDHKTNFYTALYHTMIAPNLYQDVDGRYRGMDLEIHQTNEFDYYTVFSLWDTYRAAHPLYTIIEQERTNDFINTFLAKYDEGGIMPIWDLSANYTGCMIGYHAVPVIADAYLKGITDYDSEKAFAAMKHSAMQDKLGLEAYKKLGYIPVEAESESVSKTLEYAYDDWTIAQMAKALNKPEDYKLFSERAQYYKNSFNPKTNFMQGRFRNTWFSPFDPYEVNFNYTEANAWQYSLYVPQDISGMMELMGGKEKLHEHLNKLFSAKSETSGRDQADITGLIGQYAHGNEPSHHMAYLYNFVNRPSKTQEKVHEILTTLYKNEPDGISGNEDCGQMSAWYVFSSLGFYPVTPGSNQYIIGTPLFDKATINLESGKQFTVVAENISETNTYIASAILNGKELKRSYLNHDEIIEGGVLVFKMTSQPSKWGTTDAEIPVTEIKEYLITPAPFIAEGEVAFKNKTSVALAVASEGPEIFYSINDSEFKSYTEPFIISEESNLKTYAEINGLKSSILSTQFYKINPNVSITLQTEYANQYNGGGNNALIDGIRGARDFRTGAWQGYQDTDLVAIVDLGKVQPIDSISVNFLQDQRSWIFYPTEVECYVSDSPTFYKNLPAQHIASEIPSDVSEIKTIQFSMKGYSARYIKIVAKNLSDLPKWHLGAPFNGKAWLFVDEIEVK
ncbi:MAG: GH92 family glycosyl hydrolase [Altibacter sp.]|uniref:GH92 family glycosyl hydrolase n=1 Tax=Altibacter sp. TaxID=2024823 RepID=UPI001DA34BBA|nr:GH92 family glycosyl hydrolase [Altibacter sp.]MBZ0328515.1 GH92 family glycosyl hydrolase [Altibacter sp.]